MAAVSAPVRRPLPPFLLYRPVRRAAAGRSRVGAVAHALTGDPTDLYAWYQTASWTGSSAGTLPTGAFTTVGPCLGVLALAVVISLATGLSYTDPR